MKGGWIDQILWNPADPGRVFIQEQRGQGDDLMQGYRLLGEVMETGEWKQEITQEATKFSSATRNHQMGVQRKGTAGRKEKAWKTARLLTGVPGYGGISH